VFDHAGSAFYWPAVYPLVRTGGPQVLVRSLPVGRSAGLHFTTAHSSQCTFLCIVNIIHLVSIFPC